jgi:hypothetical protein
MGDKKAIPATSTVANARARESPIVEAVRRLWWYGSMV